MSKKFTYDTDMLGYHVLTNEDLDAIHEATLDLMHDYGVQMHGKEALEILEGAGCEVDYEIDRVRFPKGLVNDAIESTPAEITLCGRDPFRQRWYLLAKVLDNSKNDDIGELRTYGLDRIVSAVETDDSYAMPDNFEANNIFANLVGISGIGNKIEEVKIVVEEEQAKYLRTLRLHQSQKEVWTGEWESEFEYKLIVNEEFMRELRAYGPSLEVLEPDWLREEFRKEAERTLRAYKKTKGKN